MNRPVVFYMRSAGVQGIFKDKCLAKSPLVEDLARHYAVLCWGGGKPGVFGNRLEHRLPRVR
jgi:hypothetical protein